MRFKEQRETDGYINVQNIFYIADKHGTLKGT